MTLKKPSVLPLEMWEPLPMALQAVVGAMGEHYEFSILCQHFAGLLSDGTGDWQYMRLSQNGGYLSGTANAGGRVADLRAGRGD